MSSDRVVRRITLVSSDIDTDLDPSQETVSDVVTEVDELWEWVVVVLSLDNGPPEDWGVSNCSFGMSWDYNSHVFSVGGDGLGVGVVWVGL